jgi:ferredoxin--NADP+ reductase
MFNWVDGKVIENRHWTDSLYSLRIAADLDPYCAGQFGRLGLQIDNQIVGRPYSYVSAPGQEFHEFYSIVVPEGPISPRLAVLQPGDHVYVNRKANGFFTLSEVPDSRDLWMMATGTGLGPYLSILQTDDPWRRFTNLILVHAVRKAEELTYQELIGEFTRRDAKRFQYIPFVSRETTDFALAGRVPGAIKDGKLELRANLKLDAQHSQIMICGNPDMVKDTREILEERGLSKNLRRTPGQITTENYW